MTNTISNIDDVIDSRDVIARIEELESERADLVSEAEDYTNAAADESKDALKAWDEENAEELKALKGLASEAEGYSDDWEYGATLVRGSYFVDYCRELVSDIGDIPKEIPSYIEIDWDATAANIMADYTSADFDGVTYYVR